MSIRPHIYLRVFFFGLKGRKDTTLLRRTTYLYKSFFIHLLAQGAQGGDAAATDDMSTSVFFIYYIYIFFSYEKNSYEIILYYIHIYIYISAQGAQGGDAAATDNMIFLVFFFFVLGARRGRCIAGYTHITDFFFSVFLFCA